MPGHDTGMQRYSRPGEALHIGHRGIAVEIGAVPSVFADDAEDAERGRMTTHAGRNRRACDQRTVVINCDPLVCDRDDDLERPVRCIPRLLFLDRLRLFVPLPVFMSRRGMSAPPGS